MSIEQSDKIDFISTTKSGKVQLTISDHLEWNDEEMHLLILHFRNALVKIIEDGKVPSQEELESLIFKAEE